MKKNPFYGISAAAMLLGCYLLNHALELEPGRLGKLLVLMGVLQVYEGLLIALGVFLAFTGIVQILSRSEKASEARSRRMKMIEKGATAE